MKKLVLCNALFLALATSSADAQVVQGLLHEGQSLTGIPAAHTVVSFGDVCVNQNGGYAVLVRTHDGANWLSHIWGSATGSAPGLLQTEATHGGLTQTTLGNGLGSFGNDIAFTDAGLTAYSASGTGGPLGTFRGAWLGNTPVAIEGTPHPSLTGKYWGEARSLGVTGGGMPYVWGEICTSSGGPVEREGVFSGLNGSNAVMLGGDLLPGLPEPIQLAGEWWPSFPEFSISAQGSNYIASVRMDGPSVNGLNDLAVVFNGAGLMLGGSLVQKGGGVPASIGGLPGEAWDDFSDLGITESGLYIFRAQLKHGGSTRDVIVVNGKIQYREDAAVAGSTTMEYIDFDGMTIGEEGHVAFYGGTLYNQQFPNRQLFFDGQPHIRNGDPVSWGAPNPTSGPYLDTMSSVRISSDEGLYFVVRAEGLHAGYVRVFSYFGAPATPSSFCFGDGSGTNCICANVGAAGEGCANSTNEGALLVANGLSKVSADSLTLTVAHCPPNTPGIFFQGNALQPSPLFLGDGLLCTTGGLTRMEVVTTGVDGFVMNSQLTSVTGATNPGETRFYQFWYRDPLSPCGSGSNTSNALQVDWE